MTDEIIDCLIIGHNEMDFADYESNIRKTGTDTGAYRDLDLNFIQYNNKPSTASEIFNLFYYSDNEPGSEIKPLTTGETFSAAVAYLGTYLDRAGFSFDYVNSFRENRDELAEKLRTRTFRAIAVTTTLYVSVFPIIEIIDFIRKSGNTAKIIVGGPFIYTQYRAQEPASLAYLFNSVMDADFYVIGSQGEAALVELLTGLKNNSDFSAAPPDNVYCKPTGGTKGDKWPAVAVVKENNPLSENMVNWKLFSDNVGEYANLRTAISCPFSCAFCGFPQHAGKYQTAGIEEIENELKSLDKIGTVKSVHFIDDTFNIPVKRFKEILRMLIRNKFRFKWYSHFRCQFADRETVELMKESGCEGVFLGIESGSDRVLENMNKAVKIDKYRDGIAKLKANNILTYGSFIVGFPGETDDTVRDTVRFIEEGGLDFFRAQLWYCDPITPVWQDREKYRLKGSSFEWSHATMDSNRAADLVDDIFMSIERPIWVPQYNFECDAIFHLLHRELDLDTIKNFLESFNHAVREKVKHGARREIDSDCIRRIKGALRKENRPVDSPRGETDLVEKFDADFDF